LVNRSGSGVQHVPLVAERPPERRQFATTSDGKQVFACEANFVVPANETFQTVESKDKLSVRVAGYTDMWPCESTAMFEHI
jgi:hypothetical protein